MFFFENQTFRSTWELEIYIIVFSVMWLKNTKLQSTAQEWKKWIAKLSNNLVLLLSSKI